MALLASLPPWPLVEEILRTLVLPTFAAAAVVLAIVCALTRSPWLRAVGAAVALILGLVAGNHFHHQLDWWPSPFLRGWRGLLPVISMGIVLASVFAKLSAGRHGSLGLGLRLLVAAVGTWWLMEALAPFSEMATFCILLLGVVLNWEVGRVVFARLSQRASLLVLATVWGGTCATLLIFAHSARFSDLAVLLTSSLCGVGLIAALWKLEVTSLLAAPCIFFPCLLLAGAANTYSEVPMAAFACVAFAPVALLLVLLPRVNRLPLRVLTALAVVALLVPCAVGVAMAARVESLDYGE